MAVVIGLNGQDMVFRREFDVMQAHQAAATELADLMESAITHGDEHSEGVVLAALAMLSAGRIGTGRRRANEWNAMCSVSRADVTALRSLSGIDKAGVLDILESAGLGLPSYYEWRTCSGCTFCFFQQKIEWVRLSERHPEFFEEAQRYEKTALEDGSPFTWSHGESAPGGSAPMSCEGPTHLGTSGAAR